MRLELEIAKRYLFGKKQHNSINIISGITATGVLVGTAALVCILSVFNGFGDLAESLFCKADPEIKITPAKGKTLDSQSQAMQKARATQGIAQWNEVVEENVLFRFGDRQATGKIKGIEQKYNQMVDFKDILLGQDNFLLNDGVFDYSIAGVGLAAEMGFVAHLTQPLEIYAPKREGRINIANPTNSFTQKNVFVSSIFSVSQADYDNDVVFVSIDVARELYEYDDNTATSIECSVAKGANMEKVKKALKETLGDSFRVQDRFEQQADYYRIIAVEKWMCYLILSFILLIAVFNVIGCLSMLIIDKRDDIRTLRDLGANESLIKRIFLLEGWLISAIGAVGGVVLGSLLCLAQEYWGIITMPGSSLSISAYPVSLHVTDIILVLGTVCVMGIVAAAIPTRRIKTSFTAISD